MTSFDIRRVELKEVRPLFERFHGYGSFRGTATYAFAVFEKGAVVAAYLWQPPPPGCAVSVSPYEPGGVLSLSRMVAVPKASRVLRHVSKPLLWQMKHGLDRGRYPALVTFSDASLGHTGYVYQCSGWTRERETETSFFSDLQGNRVSKYTNGQSRNTSKLSKGRTVLTRWENWVCDKKEVSYYMERAGWVKIPTNRKWKSGSVAYTWVRVPLPSTLQPTTSGTGRNDQ